MAILAEVPGIEVLVVVAGRDAIEYEDPDAPEQQNETPDRLISTKYIECINGANFGVKLILTKDYDWSYRNHGLCFNLYADGTRLRCPVLVQSDLIGGRKISEVHERELYNTEMQQWQGQKFQFSAVTTVDDVSKDRIKGDLKVAANLGTIMVKVWRCKVGSHRPPSENDGRDTAQISRHELSEKALKGKAISHGMSFSTPGKISAPTFVDTEYFDKKPIVEFQFHYRSRGALKREMVIPRTPSPDPAAMPDVANMSRAELEKLAQERLKQLKTKVDVKEERKPVIKQELKRKAGEVVDLSDDNPRPKRVPVFVDLTED